MTEGPSILFIKNKLQRYKGKTVSEVSGDTSVDRSLFENRQLVDIQAFGKKILFVFKDFFVSIEVSSAANILVNKRKKISSGFSFRFNENEVNFYDAEVTVYPGKPAGHFNFKTDILKPEFDAGFVLNELQTNQGEEMIEEVLMNQNIFAGIGSIIRTETLYHAKIHPESLVKSIPEKKLIFLLKMVVDYAEEFLILLKTDHVEKNALIFEKKICPKDKTPISMQELGTTKSYVCLKCQKLFK